MLKVSCTICLVVFVGRHAFITFLPRLSLRVDRDFTRFSMANFETSRILLKYSDNSFGEQREFLVLCCFQDFALESQKLTAEGIWSGTELKFSNIRKANLAFHISVISGVSLPRCAILRQESSSSCSQHLSICVIRLKKETGMAARVGIFNKHIV